MWEESSLSRKKKIDRVIACANFLILSNDLDPVKQANTQLRDHIHIAVKSEIMNVYHKIRRSLASFTVIDNIRCVRLGYELNKSASLKQKHLFV